MKKVIRIDLDATTPESAPARVAGGRVIENCEDGHAAAGLAALPSTSRPDTTAVGPREVELKLQLPPGSRATLEGSPAFAAAEADQRHEVTTYFDTPDGVLDHAGLTLRVRRSGDTRTQTVK